MLCQQHDARWIAKGRPGAGVFWSSTTESTGRVATTPRWMNWSPRLPRKATTP